MSALVLELIQRERLGLSPADLLREREVSPVSVRISASERPLVRAAASVAAGEPKRALRALEVVGTAGSDDDTVRTALRRVALALDRNWFPGGAGAVLEEGDIARILHEPLPQGSPAVAPLTYVASNVAAMIPTWRSIAEGSRRTGQAAPAAAVLQAVEGIGAEIAALGDPRSLGYLAMIHADLCVRAGQWPAAAPILGRAYQAYQAVNDIAGVASVSLIRGDWSAEPTSNPETLGLDIETAFGAPPYGVTRDLDFARELYTQAQASFALVGSQRGAAAIELRLAHLARISGQSAATRARLGSAVDLAERAGDRALVQLARIHLALVDIEESATIDPEAVGAAVAAWAVGDGSYSYARGLARLAVAASRRWRESGDFARGRTALRVADAINSGIGAVQEPALVGDEVAALYGGVNYRRALLILLELDVDETIAALDAGGDPMPWMVAVERAVRAHGAATSMKDPAAIDATAARLRRLRSHADSFDAGTTDPGQAPFVAAMTAALDEFVAQGEILAELYRATAARNFGWDAEAADRFSAALQLAMGGGAGPSLLQAVVLASMERRDEARTITRELVAAGQLPPDLASALFLRAGDAAAARDELRKLDALGPPPSGERPFADVVLRAEVSAANGEWDTAARLSDEAVRRFESRLARLSRDVLRISVSDDLDVVSAYTTAIRASLAGGGADGVPTSFRLSDRCRGIALADLLAGDLDAASPATARALRRWLRAGVLLACEFEAIAQELEADGTTARSRIAAAERELDESEEALAMAAPQLILRRREPPATPEIREIQAVLNPGTLLIQYHLFDDELFAWTVTESDARVVRQRLSTGTLTGSARRFHRLCADPSSAAGERRQLATTLSDLLLARLGAELQNRARVVIVPHAGLSLLPFHVLPYEGDVLGAVRTVSYLPAASLSPRWRDHAAPRLGQNSLVVGDARYAAGTGLRQLPAARTEAAVLGAWLGVEPLLGESATAAAVTARLPKAHVLHLASHGRTFDGAPNSAELALADGDRLTIAEVMGADTDIDLAVLSACDTGRGSATASGDIVGLTRALLAAAARDIVVSLWPVDDQAACLTMLGMYERLLAGSDIATALSAAQAAVRDSTAGQLDARYAELAASQRTAGAAPLGGTREWSPGGAARPGAGRDPHHPAFWAPFVHVGL